MKRPPPNGGLFILTYPTFCRTFSFSIALSLQAMNIDEEILDLPEEKKAGRDFKWLRIIALFFFILALFFRFNKWAGQAAFLLLGVFTFCVWALMKFIYAPTKYAYEWLFLFGRVGMAVGLVLRFIYDFAFSSFLVYSSIAMLMAGFWIQSRSSQDV